ncbi:MAG TPA: biotin/lipoate A/B protein ligase family protein [Thermoplasmata archaeon]|jgi:lipoate-protein ligase A
MSGVWRLIDSGMVQPAESAALDEAILDAHIDGLVPDTLHFYVRARPTVSVGYFQKISESVSLEGCRERGVAIVRRKSGGSSIFTDSGQLIYGLVLSESDLPQDRTESFRLVCSSLARAIASLGVEAVYRPMNDIEVSGNKVSGNAQLRRKGSVLQHGTVILDTDLKTMDEVLRPRDSRTRGHFIPSARVSTLRALTGTVPSMEHLKRAITSEIEATFDVKFERGTLTAEETASVARLVQEFYSREDWNLKF